MIGLTSREQIEAYDRWYNRRLDIFERRFGNKITKVLKKCQGNMTHAAQKLGISRNTLYAKIEKYGINAKDYAEQ